MENPSPYPGIDPKDSYDLDIDQIEIPDLNDSLDDAMMAIGNNFHDQDLSDPSYILNKPLTPDVAVELAVKQKLSDPQKLLEIFDGSDFTFKQKSSNRELKDSFDFFFNENIHGQQDWVNFQNEPEKPAGKKSEIIEP